MNFLRRMRLRRVARRLDAYRFRDLIDHMMSRHGWNEEKSQEVFLRLKRFYLSCNAGKACPEPDIDEMWHEHILHTEEYIRFCRKCFGGYLHHRPFKKPLSLAALLKGARDDR